MRLFVWTQFLPDWTSGLAFAIAEDEAEARTMIEKEIGYDIYNWGKLEVLPIGEKIARAVSGGG